ncbi:MAG: hypothetical protein WAL32_06345 [Terriglobales bacterium]
MSKTWEHYHHASRHHEKAAYHYKEAAKYYQSEELEKAAHHAYLAHGHNQHAMHHDAEAAKLHAEYGDGLAAPVSKQGAGTSRAAQIGGLGLEPRTPLRREHAARGRTRDPI